MPYVSPKYVPMIPSVTSKFESLVCKVLICLAAFLDIVLALFFILLVVAISSGKGSLEFEVPDKGFVDSLEGITIVLFFVYGSRVWPYYSRLWSLSSVAYQRITNEDLWVFLCTTLLTYVAETVFLTVSIVSLWHIVGAPKLQGLAAVLLIVAVLIRILLSRWNHDKDTDSPRLARVTLAISTMGAMAVTCLAGVILCGGGSCSHELIDMPHRYTIQVTCQNTSLGNQACLLGTTTATSTPLDIVLNGPGNNVLASRVLPRETGPKHGSSTLQEDSRTVTMLYEVTDMSSHRNLYNQTMVSFSCAKTHGHLCNACSKHELDQLSVNILPRNRSGCHGKCSSRKVLPLASSWNIGYRYCESWGKGAEDYIDKYMIG